MKKEMAKLGLKFEFVDATDGQRPLSAAEIDLMGGKKMLRRYEGDHYLTGGAIGCTISHLRCYKKLLASPYPCALILEDDAVFKKDFMPVLRSILNIPQKWNQVRIGYLWSSMGVPPFVGKNVLPNNMFLRRRLSIEGPTENGPYYWGTAAIGLYQTHAYLINRVGSEFALKHYPAAPPMPIDSIMSNCPMPFQRAVYPRVALQDGSYRSATWRLHPENKTFTLSSREQALSHGSVSPAETGAKNESSPPARNLSRKGKFGMKALLKSLLSAKFQKTLAKNCILEKMSFTFFVFFGFRGYTVSTALKLKKNQKKMRRIQAE